MDPGPDISAPRPPAAEFLPLERGPDAPSSLRGRRPPTAGELGMGALLRFRSMMALAHQPVHLARMCRDRRYAYERIAAAHASGDDVLRCLALELFQIFHRRENSGGLPQ